jgi:Trk K+ transport system NAD-binding subunit
MFRQYHVHLLLIKKAGLGEIVLPSGEYNLRADDIIFIAGKNEDLMKFEESS